MRSRWLRPSQPSYRLIPRELDSGQRWRLRLKLSLEEKTMTIPLIDWADRSQVIEEWLPYIGQTIDAEEYQAISLLFSALASEVRAHTICEEAWDRRNEQAPCELLCSALDKLGNALQTWQGIYAWIGERLSWQESQELTKLQASCSAHCQRLRRLYRNLQGLIARSAKESRELLQMTVLREEIRAIPIP